MEYDMGLLICTHHPKHNDNEKGTYKDGDFISDWLQIYDISTSD